MASFGKITKQFAMFKPTRMIGAAMLLLALKTQAATINYVGSLDTNNAPEVNNWLTPATTKTYDLDGDNIYGTFAAVSWGNYTNYTASTISFVDMPGNTVLNNESGFSAQVDDLSGACAGNLGSGVAINPTGQGAVYMARANTGNSVLYTNGMTISIARMWHTFQVNSNLNGKTLRVGIMTYCYGQSGSINPHDQDSGQGLWIAQVVGGTAKSVVAPVSAGPALSPPVVVAPNMTFFDIVDAHAGDQYTVFATRDLFVRANPSTYFGPISFDVIATASVPATKPYINNNITSGYVTPATTFGTQRNPSLSGGTNYGYTGVIRTNYNYRFGVLAGSAKPATYQWYHGATPISNATNAIYEIANATVGDAGNYQVVVSSVAGSATSQVYSVTVVSTNLARQVNGYRAQAFATPGLYAYYGFDNGLKDMKGTNDGYFVGSPGVGAQIGTGLGSGLGENDGTLSEIGFYTFGAGVMQIPYNPAFDFNNAKQEGTIVMWVRPEWCWTGGYRQSFLMANGTNGNARWGLNMGRTKQGLAAYKYDPTVAGTSVNPISLGTTIPGGSIASSGNIGTKWVMLTAVFSNGFYTAYCNGVQLGAGASTPSTNQAFTFAPPVGMPITIGALDADGNNNWNGGLDEIAVYTNALTSAQIQSLFNASDVPYAVTQPVGGSFAPGDIYSLTYVASNNWNIWQSSSQPSTVFTPNPLSYQWYTNGVPVAGATASSINFAGITTNDAGTYVCVVTNVAGSVTSSPAILTVAYPKLSATSPTTSGGNSTISWPSSYTLTGWYLQETPSLQPPTWTDYATNSPVAVPSTNAQDFFRLVRPY